MLHVQVFLMHNCSVSLLHCVFVSRAPSPVIPQTRRLASIPIPAHADPATNVPDMHPLSVSISCSIRAFSDIGGRHIMDLPRR